MLFPFGWVFFAEWAIAAHAAAPLIRVQRISATAETGETQEFTRAKNSAAAALVPHFMTQARGWRIAGGYMYLLLCDTDRGVAFARLVSIRLGDM
jgi:hypothetical protein